MHHFYFPRVDSCDDGLLSEVTTECRGAKKNGVKNTSAQYLNYTIREAHSGKTREGTLCLIN